MSFPFTIRSLPIWKANEYGSESVVIKALNSLASSSASSPAAVHDSSATGNSSSPLAKARSA